MDWDEWHSFKSAFLNYSVVDSEARTNGQLTDSAPACNEDGEDEVIIVEDTDSSILAHLHSSGAPVSTVSSCFWKPNLIL